MLTLILLYSIATLVTRVVLRINAAVRIKKVGMPELELVEPNSVEFKAMRGRTVSQAWSFALSILLVIFAFFSFLSIIANISDPAGIIPSLSLLSLAATALIVPVALVFNGIWNFSGKIAKSETYAFINKKASKLLVFEIVISWIAWIYWLVFFEIVVI